MSPSPRVYVLTYRARRPSEEDVARWAIEYTSEQYRWNVEFAVSTLSASVAWHQQTTEYATEGGFDLYRAQLESYLAQRECWGILAGTDTRDGSNDAAQAIWDEHNGFARDTLLRDLLAKDAKRVCKLVNGHDMWVAFEQDKTKRAFASVIRVRKELYTTIFRVGGDMDKYLEKLEDLRRQLANMNAVITDGEMANIILQGVETTHRSVVRLFNSPNMVGAGNLEPDLDVVLNTLRGEAERAKSIGDGIKSDDERPVKAMQAKPWDQQKKKPLSGGRKKGKKETRACYYCKKKGHLRAQCYAYKANQKKVFGGDDGKSPGKNGGGNNKSPTPSGLIRWTGALGDENNLPVPVSMLMTRPVSQGGDTCMMWILDNGSGVHVCTNRQAFTCMEEHCMQFVDWEGHIGCGQHRGLVHLRAANALDEYGGVVVVELPNTRFTPNGTTNILSQELLEKQGWMPSYPPSEDVDGRKHWFTRGDARLEFVKMAGHYWLRAKPVLTAVMNAKMRQTPSKLLMWHMKFAHMNTQALRQAFEANVVDGMDLKARDFEQPLKCIACAVAKAKRMAIKRHSDKRSKMPYERLMSDVCYVGLQTPGKAKYFQLIDDEASRFKRVFMLKKKSEAALNVIKLILRLEKKHVILTFSCDQGWEFVNIALTTFLEEHGVRLLTTNAYTPEENCLVEKLNGVLLSTVRAVQEAAKLPACLWGEVLSYAVYVDNRSITKALGNMTPHEKLLGEKPNVSKLRVCGSVAFYHIPKPKQRNKLEMRAKPAIFIGYAEELIGYRLIDLMTGALIECRSVTWREDLTVDADYLEKLVARRYYDKVVELPKNLSYVSLPVQQVGDTSVGVDPGESGARNQFEGAKSQAVADGNDSDVSMMDSDSGEVSDDSMNGDAAVPSLDHDHTRGEDDSFVKNKLVQVKAQIALQVQALRVQL